MISFYLKTLACFVLFAPLVVNPILAEDTIKVGILHSESGTMAISEMPLIDVARYAIHEINEKGGLLGKKVEAVKVDPQSDWDLYAEGAKELLEKHRVAAIFGCWTSISRKRVIPVLEKHNGLMFYPVQYEGEECSYNVFYTGAAPNQQTIPAIDYLMNQPDGSQSRWMLVGTDYVFPRTTNRIVRAYLQSKGVHEDAILEDYTPFGHADWSVLVSKLKEWRSKGPVKVLSTINGDANVHFFKALEDQGIEASDIPVMSLSIGEEELRAMNPEHLAGHYAAWNYFMSINNPKNKAFIEGLKAHTDEINLFGSENLVTTDPMEATYIGVHLWAQAVTQAGTADVNAVRQALRDQAFDAPSGFRVVMNGKNHHLQKPVFIGKIKPDAQFEIVWQTPNTIKAQPWSPFLAENQGKNADWTYPWSCGDCKAPKYK